MSIIKILIIELLICLFGYLILKKYEERTGVKDDFPNSDKLFVCGYFVTIILIFCIIWKGIIFLIKFICKYIDWSWILDNSAFIFMGLIIFIALSFVITTIEIESEKENEKDEKD